MNATNPEPIPEQLGAFLRTKHKDLHKYKIPYIRTIDGCDLESNVPAWSVAVDCEEVEGVIFVVVRKIPNLRDWNASVKEN